MVNKWLMAAQGWVYPATCLLCGAQGAEGRDLCAACADELPWHGPACTRCATPLAAGDICGACLKKAPPFACTLATFSYREPLAGLLHRLKYRGRLEAARLLGELMAEDLARRVERVPQCIVPVPLHSERLRERGYNQALELARPLARHFRVPVDYCHCHRDKATQAQTDLSPGERMRNVRGAFVVERPYCARHVAIVDDVMTTGSTVGEFARSLHASGVEQIDVWVCARTF